MLIQYSYLVNIILKYIFKIFNIFFSLNYLENKKSKTLYVRGLDVNKFNTKELYNLFGNFGNIKYIVLMKSKNAVLMEFENVEFATQAKDFLNNTVYGGG